MHVVRVVAGVHQHAQARHASSQHPQHPQQHVICLPAGPQVPALVVRSQSLVVSRTQAAPSISRTTKQLAPRQHASLGRVAAVLRQLVKLQHHTSKHLLLQHAHAQRLPAARPRQLQRAVLAFAPGPERAVDRHSSSCTKAAAICLPWPELAALPARRTLQAILQHKPPPSSSISVSRAAAAAALARVKPGSLPPLLRAAAAAAPAPAGRDASHGRLPWQSRAAAAATATYSFVLVGSEADSSPQAAGSGPVQAMTQQAAVMHKRTSELSSAATSESTAAAAAACSSGGGGGGGNSAAAGSGSAASTGGEGSKGNRQAAQGAHWGNPIGGTLFVNPDCQSVAAEHQPAPAATSSGTDGASSHSSTNSASPSSSTGGFDAGATGRSQPQSGSAAVEPGRLRAAAALGAAAPATRAPARPRLPVSPAAAPAAVAAAGKGVAAAIPTPLVVKLGVLLMGAAAATAFAGLWYARGGSGSSSSGGGASLAGVTGATTAGVAGAAAGAAVGPAAHHVPPVAAAGAAETALPGYTQWMVARLSSTIKQFENESSLLTAELSMLQALQQQQAAGAGGGLATRLRGWLTWRGSSRAGGGGEGGPAGAAATAAAAAGGGGQLSEPDLSPAGIAARMASLREQLHTLEVLRAALTAELRDHQQQQLQQQQQGN